MLPFPTEDTEDGDKDAFYEALANDYDQCASQYIKIVIGDFNSQIRKENIFGKTTGSFSVHNKTNKNGLRLINFAAMRNMIISSTKFNHPDIHSTLGNILIKLIFVK
jgi:hypothetical protein